MGLEDLKTIGAEAQQRRESSPSVAEKIGFKVGYKLAEFGNWMKNAKNRVVGFADRVRSTGSEALKTAGQVGAALTTPEGLQVAQDMVVDTGNKVIDRVTTIQNKAYETVKGSALEMYSTASDSAARFGSRIQEGVVGRLDSWKTGRMERTMSALHDELSELQNMTAAAQAESKAANIVLDTALAQGDAISDRVVEGLNSYAEGQSAKYETLRARAGEVEERMQAVLQAAQATYERRAASGNLNQQAA